MSAISPTVRRTRLPKMAQAAVARAKLTVAPAPVSSIPRAGFIVVVSVILSLGVVGLLMFNTSMQQASFLATKLDAQATKLAAQQQQLELELAAMHDPQQVAVAARKLGMVPPPSPTFILLTDGSIVGEGAPATSADAVQINPLPAPRPKELTPEKLIITVKPEAQSPQTQKPKTQSTKPTTKPKGQHG